MDKPYFNRPPRINTPQLPLFKETLPSRDCFLDGRPEFPDQGREYIPWTNDIGRLLLQHPLEALDKEA